MPRTKKQEQEQPSVKTDVVKRRLFYQKTAIAVFFYLWRVAEKHCLIHENALGVFFFYGRFFLIRKKQAFCEVLALLATIRIYI